MFKVGDEVQINGILGYIAPCEVVYVVADKGYVLKIKELEGKQYEWYAPCGEVFKPK